MVKPCILGYDVVHIWFWLHGRYNRCFIRNRTGKYHCPQHMEDNRALPCDCCFWNNPCMHGCDILCASAHIQERGAGYEMVEITAIVLWYWSDASERRYDACRRIG